MTMGLFAAIQSGFAGYFDFKGVATRLAFWKWMLFLIFLAVVAGVVDLILGFGTVTFPLLALLALPTAAVFTRRMHDIEQSGLWGLLIFTIIGILPLCFWCAKKGRL